MVTIKESIEKESTKDFVLVNGVLRFRGRFAYLMWKKSERICFVKYATQYILVNLVVLRCTITLKKIIGGVE